MTDREQRIASRCAELVNLARDQEGAHYLWGSAGSVPDQDNDVFGKGKNIFMHPNIPDPSSADPFPDNPLAETRRKDGKCGHVIYKPILLAAWCRIDTTRPAQVCAGLSDDSAVKARPKCILGSGDTDTTRQQPVAETLRNQLAYPWTYLWPRPMRNIDNNTRGDIAWGEPCNGVMHFDCVGLINWCLSKLCGKPIQNEIYQYNNTTKENANVKNEKGYGWTVPVKQAFVDYQPGDILTDGNHHIGMVSFDGIVQAADTPLGVIVSQNYGGTWTHHMRLSDYFWTAHGGVKQ
jgi:hypothetical protein